MKVLVCGAGIGGLATALSLHAAGIDVTVYEAVSDVRPLGLGIHLQPNAVRELTELGLGEVLSRNGIPIERLAFFNVHGQQIWDEPRGVGAGYRWPQYAIHRGRLQQILLEAAIERLGPGGVITSRELIGLSQTDDAVQATFRDRTNPSDLHTVRGDVLVGGDGLHSVVRNTYHPGQELRFSGQLMWRSSVEADAFLDGRTFVIAGHREQKVVAYPIEDLGDGRVVLTWIAELGISGDAPPREDWNSLADKSRFIEAFAEWRFDWLDVPAMLERSEAVFEFPKVDRDPIDRWTVGRITLVGDAAHPMQPTGSQAGSQAIVDGRSLAFHLAGHDDPVAGLLAYEADRLPSMRAVALENRTLGPERVMDIVQERAPQGFQDVNDVLSRAELQDHADGFKAIAGLGIEALNARASYDARR